MKAWLNFTNGGPLEFGFSDSSSFGVFAINFITIVLGILIYIYLYKTAKVFTKLSKEENVSRETF